MTAHGYEPEAGRIIAEVFEQEGIRVLTNTSVRSVREEGNEVVATIQTGEDTRELRAEKLLVSTGRALHAYANMQTIMTKMKRVDTAFGEFGGAKTFGSTSQLLPYGVPLTAGTIGVLLTCYFGGWLS